MKRQAYYPSRAADQVLWLENFRNKLTAYQVALALTVGQLTAGIADARWLAYVLGSWLPAVRAFAPACTDAMNFAMTGNGAALTALPVFTAPALPAGVAATFSGALNRIFALIQTIKDAAGYTEAIGTDLGLVGSQQTMPPAASFQPILKAKVNGTGVDLIWGWEGHSAFLDMCELQVDRADGKGFVLLAFDTTPNYTDTAPFPAALTKWTYRGIYHANDQRVGLWSVEAPVIVGG